MSTVKTDSVIGSFLPIPVIEHATDYELFTATVGQTVFTTTKFDRSNAIRVIARGSGGAFTEVTASWTGANTVTITGMLLGAGQILYIFKVGTHASKIRIQNAAGAWVDLATFGAAQRGDNSDITSLSGLTTPLSQSQGGTGKNFEFRKGHIEGLVMTFDNLAQVTVSPGSVFIEGSGSIITANAPIVVALPASPATGWWQVYAYDNGGTVGIEVSQTQAVKYFGSARSKIGDTSRRYIGSILAATGGTGFYQFRQLENGRVFWTQANPGAAPFLLVSASSATIPTVVAADTVVPLGTVMVHTQVSAGTSSVVFGTEDQAVSIGQSRWICAGTQNASTQLDILLDLRNDLRRFQYMNTASGSATTIYVTGYTFER